MLVTLGGFVFGFLGSVPLAGPIAVLVLRKGIRGEYRQGIGVAAGGSLAEAIYCALAVLGFESLLAAHPGIEAWSKLGGAAMMIALGAAFMLMRLSELPQAEPHAPVSKLAGPFFIGFSIAAFNPVLILTWSGVAAILHAFTGPFSSAEKVLFPVAVGLGVFSWFRLMLSLIKKHSQSVSTHRMMQAVRAFGVVLALVGVWMIIGHLTR